MALSFAKSRRIVLVHADAGVVVVSAVPGDAGSLGSPSVRAGASAFAVLGADRYLVRRFDLPEARPDELGAMVRLRAEAGVPAVFGAFEVSYRVITSDTPGGEVSVEAYLAKRSVVQDAITSGESASVRVCSVIPSAALWASVLASAEPGEVFIASAGLHRFELVIAGGGEGEAFEVHALEAKDDVEYETELRAVLRAIGRGGERVGEPTWIGAPPVWLGGGVEVGIGGDSSGLLTLGALGSGGSGVATTVGLVPESAVRRSVLRRRVGRGGLAAGMLIGVLGSTIAGFEVAASRCREETARLDALVSQIRVESEASERRLSQVDAVASARATQQDFSGLLAGLFRASPQRGLSFSLVEGDSSGLVTLRGHADELSLPFELPERLERDPAFADVMLTDTGRSVRGGSSVSEFAAEARLVRGRPR